MVEPSEIGPEPTAVRVALWRALHAEIDPAPHVLDDVIGMRLAAETNWRQRRDMDPRDTARSRASIVARARFIEDLVLDQLGEGVGQYVILGAGLDTFAQRRPDAAGRLTVFEIDQPGPQAWKRQRLAEEGFAAPDWLRFVPVDFEAGNSWLDELAVHGFDAERPCVVASTGVAMYLTREAILATLRQIAGLAAGSTLAMTFMVPLDLVEAEERPGREMTEKFARMAGTPFLSLFAPDEIVALAGQAGLAHVQHVSPADMTERYFADRPDRLRPSSSEHLLLATI